jgi:Arc/MetJ-type ribon-helix-helix transcriptional regulator
MTKSITVRVPSDRVARLDALVESGAHPSRTSVIIEAIDRLVAQLESEAIDRAIVEGYTRMPQTEEELEYARVAGRRSVAAEPW